MAGGPGALLSHHCCCVLAWCAFGVRRLKLDTITKMNRRIASAFADAVRTWRRTLIRLRA